MMVFLLKNRESLILGGEFIWRAEITDFSYIRKQNCW